MALSYEQYFGTGSQTLFNFSFEYLSRSHVKASVDGVEVPFDWVGTYTVQLKSPPIGNVVEVRRTTPRDKRLVRFTDGSTLVATDLNTSTLQSFFLAQEAFDQGAASMAVTEDGQYSAGTRRITSLGDPVNGQDAASKHWVETAFSSPLTQVLAARETVLTKASETATDRAAAQTARTGAEAARDSSSGHRLNSQNAETGSKAARDTATEQAGIATAKAQEAAVDRAAVALDRAAAQTARNQAEGFAASINPSLLMAKSSNLSDLSDKIAARLNLKIWTGTVAQYTALATKDADTIYIQT